MKMQNGSIALIINHSLQAHFLARDLSLKPVMEALELTILLAENARLEDESQSQEIMPIAS